MKEEYYKCIEVPATAFGFEKGKLYKGSSYKPEYLEEDEIFIFNKRGSNQVVKKDCFRITK